jgi:hypothetical protein
MSFELILPFLRPIEPLLLDESISEIMGNQNASWWHDRDAKRFLIEPVFEVKHATA